MATDWGPVVQTGIGALAALGGGVIGVRLQVRHEERTQRQQRRDRSAALLAEVSALLRDSGTQRVVSENLSLETPGVRESLLSNYEGLRDREKVVREQLVAMAISDPAPKVRRLVRELEQAIGGSLFWTRYQLAGMEDNPVLARMAKDGEKHYREALVLLDELIEAL